MRAPDLQGRRFGCAVAVIISACGLGFLNPLPVFAADLTSASGDVRTGACGASLREIWTLAPDTRQPPAAALAQLGVERLWGEQNLRVNAGGVIKVSYPAGSINPGNAHAPTGGAGFLYAGPPGQRRARTHACLAYEVKFPRDFDFVRGGKMPGMYGGEAPSGGEAVAEHPGFSLRYMWRGNGLGEVYAYLPSKYELEYGESIGRGKIRFVRGKWHRLEQEIVLNQPGAADGILRVWEDGNKVIERRDILYWTQVRLGVAGLMFSTFFGGHEAIWASPRDQAIEIRNIRFLSDES